MKAIIEPGRINGTIRVPASKSMMQRACAGALLHNGITIINHPGFSDDEKTALNIIEQAGAFVRKISEDKIEVISTGNIQHITEMDCGESGLAARLFTPICALSSDPVIIMGHGSLLSRTMQPFEKIFADLGVAFPGFSGHIPFTVLGPLKAKNISIDGSLSSQFLSGILFALSTVAKEPIMIEVTDLKSKPYIDLTLEVLEIFGRRIIHDDYRKFYINPKDFSSDKNISIKIEADWSSAAYWLVGAAINGNISIKKLNLFSSQADRKILELLINIGCEISTDEKIEVSSSSLNAFKFDATDCPDLFPILSILASCCDGESKITGLHRLKHKESDRAESIQEMLTQFGVTFSLHDDAISIKGKDFLNAATINGHNDHRIVMAASIGALKANGTVIIEGAEAVSKSYPDFFNHLSSLNVSCSLKD